MQLNDSLHKYLQLKTKNEDPEDRIKSGTNTISILKLLQVGLKIGYIRC